MYIFKCCRAEVKSFEKFNKEYAKDGNQDGRVTCPECKAKSIVYHISAFSK